MNVVFIFSALVTIIASQKCKQVLKRTEIRDLSHEQFQVLAHAITKLNHQNEKSIYDRLTQTHIEYNSEAHGTPSFFPWHRIFIREYEKELQKINSKLFLPYWDWTRDSQSPERSPILSSEFFGGNGQGYENCLVDGLFANWMMNYPEPHCLKRDFDEGGLAGTFYSPEAIEHILETSVSYDDFRIKIESAPHARVHNALGGDFGSMHSPNDPLFFFHHAFVDMLWSEWQQRHPDMPYPNFDEYLAPFDQTVGLILDTKKSDLCYTYPRYGINLPELPQPINNFQDSNDNIQESDQISQRNSEPQPRIQKSPRPKPKKSGLGLGLPWGTPLILVDDDFKVNVPIINQLLPQLRLPSTDRSTPNLIRQVPPIPRSHSHANNLDPDVVARIEKELDDLVATYNALPNFIPAANLLSSSS